MISGLLGTKLRRPTLSPAWIPRPQLASWLNDGLELGRQITLVSAPAGFGKTSCVSEWLDSLDIPIAWLSLDPADDDPGQFFTYLIAALQTVDTSIGQEIDGVLRAGQLPPGEIIYTNLINDILGGPGKFVLALDDFQVIQDGFIALGVEKMAVSHIDYERGLQVITPGSVPWSHGLLMSLVWSVAFGLVGFFILRDRQAGIVLGLVVFSHWVLDLIVHLPDLPVLITDTPILGLGLWGSRPGLILSGILEVFLLVSGIGIYLTWRRKH